MGLKRKQAAQQHETRIRSAIQRIDWENTEESLNQCGYARIKKLLTAQQCNQLIRLYKQKEHFRSRIVMESKNYGQGEYQYFHYPLPQSVESIRTLFYPPLAEIANRWMKTLGVEERFPKRLSTFLQLCHSKDQKRPTPLLLRYEAQGYNALHQDRYGEIAFPFQVAILLNQPMREFSGGEFLLLEQRPRMQSRGESIPLQRGEALIFPNRIRPIQGKRGAYAATLRHGVSRIHSGLRYTLGIIFHDAE